MKKSILVAFLILNLTAISYSQVDKDYSQTLKKMFKAAGSEEAYKAVINQVTIFNKQQYPDIPVEIWDDFVKEFLETSLDELSEMLAPVYSKYLTKEDLKRIIKFYNTTVGQKLSKSNPLIFQESFKIGQEWGKKIGENFAEKIKEKGY